MVYLDDFIQDEHEFKVAIFSSYQFHIQDEDFFKWIISEEIFNTKLTKLKKQRVHCDTYYLILLNNKTYLIDSKVDNLS